MTRRVLALRALGLGDAVTGIPALRGLRRAFGDHALVLAAPDAVTGWLRGLDVIDDALPTADLELLDPAAWSARFGVPPDVAVDLHGCGPRSQDLLRGLRPGRLVSFRCPASGQHTGPDWDAEENEVYRWCRLVSWAGGPCGPEDLRLPPAGARSAAVVVHPGAASGSRRWPADRWMRVVAALRAAGRRVVVTGGPAERELCRAVSAAAPGVADRCGALDVVGLAGLMSRAGLVLSGDTGPAHLATAYGTPSVLLFGPTPPWRWGPVLEPERHRVLWHGTEIGRPWVGDPHGEEVDPALDRITVGEVLDAVAALAAVPAAR